jgi:DNA-3-methyladenine glycosylase II
MGATSPALAHLRRSDPVLAKVIDGHPDFDPRAWMAELPHLDAFGFLVFQVIGQQLSVASTRAILGHLEDRFDARVPTAAEWLATNPDDLRQAGLSRRKVETLRLVAKEFVDQELSDDGLKAMSDDEIAAQLLAIPGIGRWTVDGFLVVALDRTDVVLSGDLALRKAIQRVYQLDHLPSEQEVLDIAEPWRPYRSLGTAYMYAAGFDRTA